MKTSTYRMLILLCLVLVIGISASAQSRRGMTAEMPFDFHAGRTELKAGTYIITPSYQGHLTMRTSDGKRGVLLAAPINVNGNYADTTPRLVFRRYANGQYFLMQVWTVAHNGLQLSLSPKERRVQKELLRQRLEARPRQVEIAAVVRR